MNPRIKLPLCGQVKEHVSFSELGLFNECQWKWLLTKVFGLAADDRSFQMDFGKAVHAGMEVLYSKENNLDHVAATKHALEMYDRLLSELVITDESDLAESQAIRDSISKFYRDCLENPDLQGIQNLKSEMKLFVPILRDDGLDLMFKGFIDIVFIKRLKRKTVIYIADFKTCRWGWPAKKFQDTKVIAQLMLYKHFFCKMTGADPKNISTCFILLKKKPRTEGELTVDVCKVSAGPKATRLALDYLQKTISGMHSYDYEMNLDACKRVWTDPETKNQRSVSCPFFGTDHCQPSSKEFLGGTYVDGKPADANCPAR